MASAIIGRNPYLENVKGRVSTIALAPGLVANYTNVTIVELPNLSLAPQADNIASLLPPNVRALSLMNGLLTTFPLGLGGFKKLQNLYVRPHLSLMRCCASCVAHSQTRSLY